MPFSADAMAFISISLRLPFSLIFQHAASVAGHFHAIISLMPLPLPFSFSTPLFRCHATISLIFFIFAAIHYFLSIFAIIAAAITLTPATPFHC
jgi:hypothetical protein